MGIVVHCRSHLNGIPSSHRRHRRTSAPLAVTTSVPSPRISTNAVCKTPSDRRRISCDVSSREEDTSGGISSKLASLLLCALVGWTTPDVLWPQSVQSRTLTVEEKRTVKLFDASTASVVNVTNLGTRQDAFTLDMMEIPQGAGTGIIWDDIGHIITNYHVIQKATEVQVTSIFEFAK